MKAQVAPSDLLLDTAQLREKQESMPTAAISSEVRSDLASQGLSSLDLRHHMSPRPKCPNGSPPLKIPSLSSGPQDTFLMNDSIDQSGQKAEREVRPMVPFKNSATEHAHPA